MNSLVRHIRRLERAQMHMLSSTVRFQQPFTAGLHRLNNLWVYISRGTGYWGPPKSLWVTLGNHFIAAATRQTD